MTADQLASHLDEFDRYVADVREVAFIPPPLVAGLRHYIQGRPTGDFLRAVLCNDLFTAVGRAHETSLAAIGPLVRLIYNAMPSVCHGSDDAVDSWISNQSYLRMETAHAHDR
jgi:hypothetical protein